jgi:hypothetical protein
MKKVFLLSFTMVAFLFMLAVIAQPPDVDRKGPCRADVEKFCKGIKAGHGRIWACLKSHEAELSQACVDHMAASKEKMKEFISACKEDKKKFCKDIRAGKGRIISCLKSHEQELSEGCRNFFQKY